MKFNLYKQPDLNDCGPTCLRMVAKHYGRSISLSKIRSLSETTREGSSLKNLADAAEKIGFRTIGVKINFEKLVEDAPLPCIVHWQQHHFVVVYGITGGKKSRIEESVKIKVADPAHGLIEYSATEFLNNWIGANATTKSEEGIALLLEPTPRLKQIEPDDNDARKGFSFLYQYLFRYKKFLFQLALGLMVGSLLQLIFPFLTQSVVDIGIQNQDINFINLILIAQLFLFFGRTSVEVIRSWILLHLSTRINISLVSDFFIKLMYLPIGYFDTKMTGDIMQRINDHRRIQSFLTSSSLNILFSFFNLIVFGAVLAWYNALIFVVFLLGSAMYFFWVIIFLKRRKELDYKRFSQMSDEQSKVIEIINGMQEIKLHNAEKQKRWSWEFLQARLFKISLKSLSLEQTQSVGSNFINEIKNIFITFLSAKLVIDGEITLGMMVAIQYIIGQLNSPITQLIGFVYAGQDAKIALERLSEIHNRPDEEQGEVHELLSNKGFTIKDASFRYTGSPDTVLEQLNFVIPPNKITAIVGTSGSGKTTLVKLLLKFYKPTKGEIKIGNHNLNNLSNRLWRDQCGVVMQEGYIFNDTIANNIAIGAEVIDKKKLRQSAEIANIKDFIEELPLAYNTKIGMEGLGMSTGQKQRLLIARAVYKDPRFIFFDEATSALDSNNEREIMDKLHSFLKGKTAIIVAHRLSTVKHADQIVVLEKGQIVERGTHAELVAKKGNYFNLVRNQLELGT